MNKDLLNEIRKAQFELNGGWAGIMGVALGGLIRWSVIAIVFALAWRCLVK